jgi:hypothetical protein
MPMRTFYAVEGQVRSVDPPTPLGEEGWLAVQGFSIFQSLGLLYDVIAWKGPRESLRLCGGYVTSLVQRNR